MGLGCNLVAKYLGSMWETLGSDCQCWENRNKSNVDKPHNMILNILVATYKGSKKRQAKLTLVVSSG